MSIFQPLPELGTELRDLAALVEHAEKFGDQFVVPESEAGFIVSAQDAAAAEIEIRRAPQT